MAKNPGERFASAGAFASTFAASVTTPIPSAVTSPMAPPTPTRHLPEAEQPTVLALPPQGPPQGPPPFAGPHPVPPSAGPYVPPSAGPYVPPSAGPYGPAVGSVPGPYGVPMPAGGPPGAAPRSRGGPAPVLAAVGGAIAVIVLAGVLVSRIPADPDPPSSLSGGTVVTVTSTPAAPATSGWTTTTSPDTTSPDTTSSLSATDQDLVDSLPSSLVRRDSCEPFSRDSSTAGVVCAAALGQEGRNTPRSVIVLQFDTRADLDASYQRQTKEALCPGGSGQWNYSDRPNVQIGNISCYQNSDDKAVVTWTYWDRKLACYAIGREASVADLRGWWKSAGKPTA